MRCKTFNTVENAIIAIASLVANEAARDRARVAR